MLVILVTAVAAWLAYEIVTRNLADHWAESRPELALRLRANSSDALATRADAQLTVGDLNGAARLAREALSVSPLNVPAIRVLALAAEQFDDRGRAEALMTIAGDRTWHDTTTHVWLYNHHQRWGEYVQAMEHADSVLRRRPDLREAFFTVLADTFVDPRAAPAMAPRLAAEPDWRPGFLSKLAERASEDDQVLSVLLDLKARGSPPARSEVSAYLARPIGSHRYREALRDWKRLSSDTSLHRDHLTDGDFNGAEGPTPFGWGFGNNAGFSAEVAEAPERARERALRIDYDGYSPGVVVDQLLALPTGSYVLTGEAYLETQGPERLRWVVSCAESGQVLTSTPSALRQGQYWRPFSAALSVPPAGCEGQRLRLVAEPGERRATIGVWYDKLGFLEGDQPIRF